MRYLNLGFILRSALCGIAGIEAFVFGRAELVGEVGIRFQIVHHFLQMVGKLVRFFQVPQHVSMVFAFNVNIAHAQDFIRQSDFDVYAFDIGVVDVGHVQTYKAGLYYDARIGKGVLDIFMFCAGGNHV